MRVCVMVCVMGESDDWTVRESAITQKLAGSIPGHAINDVVSLGKALHLTCLGGDVPVL